MSHSLAGKTILLTGAGSGIGAAAALHLASQGANVVITARTEANVRAVAAKHTGSAGKLVPLAADTAKEADWKRVVDATVAQFGGIDYVILNAAVMGPDNQDLLSCSSSDIRSIIDINITGQLLGAQSTISHLIHSKGALIITSSVASALTSPLSPLYNITKLAVDGAVRQLAALYTARGVRVYGVNPVAYESNMFTAFTNVPALKAMLPTKDAVASAFNPTGKVGDPLDIAVLFRELLLNRTVYKSGDCVAVLPSLTAGNPLTLEITFFYDALMRNADPAALGKAYLVMPLNGVDGRPLPPVEAAAVRERIRSTKTAPGPAH